MTDITFMQSSTGSNGMVEWQSDSKQVKLSITELHQAMLFDAVGLVLILTGTGEFPDTLKAYEASGKLLYSVPAPDGFLFSYLTNHPELPIAVVASSTKAKIEGWYDWHFGVNPKNGELTRHCPAY